MRYFPIFIDLAADRAVLVYGGGEDAVRKVRLLLKTDVAIEIIATELGDELADLVQSGRLTWKKATFTTDQLDAGARAVFAACDDTTNARVSAAAQQRGIPVNVVDRAALSTFIVPAIVDRDPLVIAIGTEGAGPVLAQGLRARIETILPPSIGGLLNRAAALRDTIAGRAPAGAAQREFWRNFFFGSPYEAYLRGDEAGYRHAVAHHLNSAAKSAEIGHISLLDVCDDPELLTLKAHRLLQEADIIVYDAKIATGVLEYARRDAVRRAVNGTIWSSSALERDQIALSLLEEAASGQRVVRLYDTSASALDTELTTLRRFNTNSIAVGHIRSSHDECDWAPLIDGPTVDGENAWRLAS